MLQHDRWRLLAARGTGEEHADQESYEAGLHLPPIVSSQTRPGAARSLSVMLWMGSPSFVYGALVAIALVPRQYHRPLLKTEMLFSVGVINGRHLQDIAVAQPILDHITA